MSAVLVKGNFLFDSATHRDFLGACLGTGIDRSKVGDILVQGEQGAHILVVPELVPHLEMNLTSVSAAIIGNQASIHCVEDWYSLHILRERLVNMVCHLTDAICWAVHEQDGNFHAWLQQLYREQMQFCPDR